MTWDGRERRTEVTVDPGEGVSVQIVEEFNYSGIFNDDGELRLWQDNAGWSGYEVDDDGQVYRVNFNRLEDGYAEHVEVTVDDLRESIEDHVKDPVAGGAGRFAIECSPPPAAPDEAVHTNGGASL